MSLSDRHFHPNCEKEEAFSIPFRLRIKGEIAEDLATCRPIADVLGSQAEQPYI